MNLWIFHKTTNRLTFFFNPETLAVKQTGLKGALVSKRVLAAAAMITLK